MRRAGWLVVGAVVVTVPWLVATAIPRQQRYVLHVLIFTAIFAALALSYDLVVGHVGSLSLAHPAFFGIGAYAAAILATRAGWPFPASLLAAVLAAALVAALVGVPLFRLAEHAFAVGTLGLALVASVVANNWVEVTRGPLCITGIPKPRLGALAITTLPAFYWLALTALVAVALLYRGLTTFRLGRAFHAVRDNEPLAGAAGIDPAQVPPARLHPRRRHRRRDRRALRPLPLGDVPGGDDRQPHGQPAGHRLPRRASAACAECWSAPCSSPRCPRCCA